MKIQMIKRNPRKIKRISDAIGIVNHFFRVVDLQCKCGKVLIFSANTRKAGMTAFFVPENKNKFYLNIFKFVT